MKYDAEQQRGLGVGVAGSARGRRRNHEARLQFDDKTAREDWRACVMIDQRM
jgi:hypothetical protein